MHGKEFLVSLIKTYFIIVTLITAGILVLGLYFDPDARFGYEAFAAPLIYGACGLLPSAVMYAKRELTVKELIVRKVIQLILVEGIVLFAAFGSTDIYRERKSVVTGMGVCIFLIYVLAHVIDWFWDYVSAKRITEELIHLQQNGE